MAATELQPFQARRPQREACLSLLAKRLRQLPTGDALVGRGRRDGVRIHWDLVSPSLDQDLAPEIWERLLEAGLLPPSFRDDPSRRFRAFSFCEHCSTSGRLLTGRGIEPCDECGARGAWESVAPRPSPPTLRACLTFAFDPAGIVAAERLVAAVVERLRPWNLVPKGYQGYRPAEEWRADPPSRFTWRTIHVDPKRRGHFSRRWDYLNPILVDATSRACKDIRLALPGLPRGSHMWSPEAYGTAFIRPEVDTSGHHAWQVLSARGVRVPENGMSCPFPPGLTACGRPFAELPDPFEPLCRIWELGYALEELGPDVGYLVAREIS